VLRANGYAFKFFADGVHGGRLQAHNAAKRWISTMEKNIPRRARVDLMAYRRRNNRTGTSGVVRWPADGRMVPDAYWRAFWIENVNEPRHSRKFSVSAHGEQGARRKATAERRRFLKSLTTET